MKQCLQQPGPGSDQNVHQQINGQGRCGTYTHKHTHTHTHTHNGILPSHKKNEIMVLSATWMNLEIIN